MHANELSTILLNRVGGRVWLSTLCTQWRMEPYLIFSPDDDRYKMLLMMGGGVCVCVGGGGGGR